MQEDVWRPRASPVEVCLRRSAIVYGIGASAMFVVVGLVYRLQTYGDGSMFSYAIALQESWSYHLHNIPDRLTVYLYAFLPAETFVGLTGDAHGGIIVYGLLFYAAQVLGLVLTYTTDRSRGRTIFTFACVSTACLCPLVFGFPTEMWVAHALFWPTLAASHYAHRGLAGTAAVVALMVALILTHEGAVVFALAILATLALRGWRDTDLRRAVLGFAAAMAIWGLIKVSFPPDPYYASIIDIAALKFIDPANLATPAFMLLVAALAAYAILFVSARSYAPKTANVIAAVMTGLGLAAFWLWFDRWLLTDKRYELRTVLLIGTPALGALAAAFALRAEGKLALAVPLLPRVMAVLTGTDLARAMAGAIAVIVLVHVVETTKFATAWNRYTGAVRALAMGQAFDPAMGDVNFVSSARIGPDLNRLSWFSTTPYLSVLVAPGFAPRHLVVDPDGGYYWLTCAMARASEQATRAIPRESRRLVRIYSCLHRR